jgi:5-methylcytosine-specific restriction endonuclease McrA
VHQAIDSRRGNSAARGYGHAWRQTRLIVLGQEPLCRFCNEAGRLTAATEVDHIDGNSRNNVRDNLRPLCKPCHSQRTARDQAFGRASGRP